MIITNLFGILPKPLRLKLWACFRRFQGTKGLVIRYALLKTLAVSCGENVAIFSDSFLYSPEKLFVGSNVSIHPMCYIDAAGGIVIGDDVSIAHSVTIMSSEHNFSRSDLNIKDQEIRKLETVIESNVWIGSRAVILAGTKVHTGSVVGAGAVVTKDVPALCVVVGVPAEVKKRRAC